MKLRCTTQITNCLLAFLCSLSLNANAQAQTIPIACDQYIQALKVCTQNAIDVYSRKDVESTKALKKLLEEIERIEVDIRKAVVVQGSDVIAERCTRKDAVGGMIKTLGNLMPALAYSGGLNRNCSTKHSEIQLPTK